ncbi:MAG TPA: sugar ABC transporter permease [Candidatus Limnocylindrales bacterium]|nr:sugar ABC transporter permease [Candidatus Limnocylindrales bacterium]
MTQAVHVARRGLAHRMWRARWAYAFVLVPIACFTTFELYPFLQAIVYSVSKWTLTGPGEFVGLANFAVAFRDPIFWKALGNTIAYSVAVVFGGIALALVMAALIFPLARRAKTFFKMAFYLPAVASLVVVALVWRWMYQPAFGLLNHLLGIVGLGPLGFLTDSDQALPSIMVMQILSNPTIGLGASLILILAAMNSIPGELYEAAMIDGATALQRFRRVTVPLLRPTIVFLLIIGTVETFREFTAIYLMTTTSGSNTLSGGGPFYSTTTLAYHIYVQGFLTRQFGVAAATSIVLFLIVFGLAILQFRRLNADIEY